MRSTEEIVTELRQSRTGYAIAASRGETSPLVLANWAERIRDLEAELAAAVRATGGLY